MSEERSDYESGLIIGIIGGMMFILTAQHIGKSEIFPDPKILKPTIVTKWVRAGECRYTSHGNYADCSCPERRATVMEYR